MTDPELTPAEIAAQVGTVRACWDSYADNVVRATFNRIGLPPSYREYENGSRLDFYAGAASIFQILRAMHAAGRPPSGAILQDLETEVVKFLEEPDYADSSDHKPGHA